MSVLFQAAPRWKEESSQYEGLYTISSSVGFSADFSVDFFAADTDDSYEIHRMIDRGPENNEVEHKYLFSQSRLDFD